jgi:F0F1-type ATP synthase membrane subunit c/vacuolar-type H+-ATPase subunit K
MIVATNNNIPTTYAQNVQTNLSNGTATGIQINEKVLDGDIITSNTNGYKKANSPYDPQIFGIVSLNPAIYFSDTTTNEETPVISTGNVMVRVSSNNGTIKEGDFITSSTTPGVGQKATDNGYVLGRAQQSYTNSKTTTTGLIRIILQPHYQQLTNNITHNLLSTFTLGLSAATTSPLGVIRYFVAGIITLLSFFFGFRFFARASNRGVEAIGRNPLAKQAILFSVFINTLITISIMFFGVAIAYLILVL